MAGETSRRRTGGRPAPKDATLVRKTPTTSMRTSAPQPSRKRKRFASSFEVNGQQFPSDFDAALYIVLESKSLTLRSFMDAALQEQKRLAKQNWKLALLQDHSLKSNKYALRLQSETADAPNAKPKKHDEVSSNDAMSMDEVSTDSEPESADADQQAFVASLEDCTSEEEDASPEAPRRRTRARRMNVPGNNPSSSGFAAAGSGGRGDEESANTVGAGRMGASENEGSSMIAKPCGDDHASSSKGGVNERELFSADYQNRTHCEYCHERGDRRIHSTADGDSVKVTYYCATDKCSKGFDKYIGWAIEPAAKSQMSPSASAPASRKLQSNANTTYDLSQLHSNFTLTGAALLITMQKIKPEAENNTVCPFCEQAGTEMIKDHAVIYLCLNRNCHKLSNSTHVQKIIGWRATKPGSAAISA